MLEDRCPENALLTIADRTGDHTIMASNAGRKLVQKGAKILDHPFEFLENSIPFLYPFGNDLADHLVSIGGSFFRIGKDLLLSDLLF